MTHIAGFERDQLLLLPEAVDDYVDADCSRKVKMSHRGKLGMSHSRGLRSAGVWHGLGGDERTRTSPRRGAGVGCCGPNDYDSCGGSDGRNETAGSPSGASV